MQLTFWLQIMLSMGWLMLLPGIGCDQSCHALNRGQQQQKHQQHAREEEEDVTRDEDMLEGGGGGGECHRHHQDSAISVNHEDMVHLPGGTFLMGTNQPVMLADGEAPERSVAVSPFWLDVHEVSNRQFRDFVRTTGYQTEAETFGSSFVFQSMLDEQVLANVTQSVKGAEWWVLVEGAFWRRPLRESQDRDVLDDEWLAHPVVHVSWHDARAFCRAHGKRLPSEAEWEYACRANLSRRLFPWGNNVTPRGEHRMNIWQGDFPANNTAEDGYLWTAPVDRFPANKFGLKNMVGNVWEWTDDWWSVNHRSGDDEGGDDDDSSKRTQQQQQHRQQSTKTDKVKKGGSFLCHQSYCYRYRCAARSSNTPDSSASNVGFRCAADVS